MEITLKDWNNFAYKYYTRFNHWDCAVITPIDNLSNNKKYTKKDTENLKKLGFNFFTIDIDNTLNVYAKEDDALKRQKEVWPNLSKFVQGSIDLHGFATKDELLESIVSELNNAMEKDSEFWSEELGCEPDEIVSYFGFGFVEGDETISYIDEFSIIPVLIPLDEIIKISEKAHHISEMRQLIFWIWENNK